MSNIKLIATDLDGTFFGEGYAIPEVNIKAVQQAQQAGILVCGCSARLWALGRTMMEMGGFDGMAVFNNGAAVAEWKSGAIAHEIVIPAQQFAPIVEALVPFGALIQCWNHRFIGLFDPTGGSLAQATMQRFGDPNAAVHCQVRIYDDIGQMNEDCKDVAQKIMLSTDNRLIDQVAKALASVCDVEVTSSNPRVIEITAPGATKGNGVRRLAEHYGIQPENVLAIGDSHNDVGMLEFAGVRVAVSNAEDSLKSVAQYTVAKNTEGGFAQMVREIALG